MKQVWNRGRSIVAALVVILMWSDGGIAAATGGASLESIVASRSDAERERDDSRHPKETIEFFGLEPGMRIAEVLPGGGWYTRILAPYIGSEGALYGINYADDMWPLFGFFSEEVIAERKAKMAGFDKQVAAYPGVGGITAEGHAFGRVPERLNGSLDAVLMIRALHNLNRFEQQASTRTKALKEIHALLKPGGIVGVVQHRAPSGVDDDWADGHRGYLKQAAVVAMFERAGFKLVASSEINANPKDQPSGRDRVWRLPPSLRVPEEEHAAMRAIGESDRMTLKFQKI